MKSTVSIFLDKRSKKINGAHPLKIRVYYRGQTKFYPINKGKSGEDLPPDDITEDDFNASYNVLKPKEARHKDLKKKFQKLEVEIEEIRTKINPFSFEKFEKMLGIPKGSEDNILYHYDVKIQQLEKDGQVNTKVNYEFSKRSLVKFREHRKQNQAVLNFNEVTPEFLKEYERWLISEGKSISTVGIYLRPLRAIFNQSKSGEYPFQRIKGDGGYKIPKTLNMKKALDESQLKALFSYKTEDDYINKARSFFFFSYMLQGINMIDICCLKYENITGNTLHWIRHKTKNSNSEAKFIKARIPDFARLVIETYGTNTGRPDDYIFPILKKGMTEAEKIKAVQLFTRFVNQHMQKLAEKLNIPRVSTYFARHSYSTISMRNDIPVAKIRESLGHSSIAVTEKYLASFADSTDDKIAAILTNSVL